MLDSSNVYSFPGKPEAEGIHEDIVDLGLTQDAITVLRAKARANRELRGGYHGFSPAEAAVALALAAAPSRPALHVVQSETMLSPDGFPPSTS